MDIRIFKTLILIASETVFYLILRFAPVSMQKAQLYPIFESAVILIMVTVPVLLLLPEDNWIWIVEENSRGRKISLRSKASKHLHLSMLYLFFIGYFPFIVVVSAMFHFPKYKFALSWELMGVSALYGLFCAWKNYRNVIRYDSLFAVGWDRRATFIEIFIGFKVSKGAYYFYSGFALLAGLILMVTAALAPYVYFEFFRRPDISYDFERYIVLVTFLNFFAMAGAWTTSMYIFFQMFFGRRLQRWVRTPRNKNNKEGKTDGPD